MQGLDFFLIKFKLKVSLYVTFGSKKMIKVDLINMLRRGNSVFTFKEILLASGGIEASLLKRRIHYYIKNGELYQIRKGIYAKDQDYDKLELATKIYSPAYISLETVLAREGIIFQHYSRIFVVSYLSREIVCDGQKYVYRKMKDMILANPLGIDIGRDYAVASKERAFLDILYLEKSYHFDNIVPIDKKKCLGMLPLYRNKAMQKRLHSYFVGG